MAVLLILLSLLALADGLVTYAAATTIMQQIAGLVSLGIAAVFFSGAGIVNEVVFSRKKLADLLTDIRDKLDKLSTVDKTP